METDYLRAKEILCFRIQGLKTIHQNDEEILNDEISEHNEINENEYEQNPMNNELPALNQNNNAIQYGQQNVPPGMWQFPSWKSLEKTWGDFDGTLIQWQGFHDRFKSAIHDNEQIQRAFKFQYLQNSLKGKAAAALGEWQLSDENYNEAWERLNELYAREYQTGKELLWKFHNLAM